MLVGSETVVEGDRSGQVESRPARRRAGALDGRRTPCRRYRGARNLGQGPRQSLPELLKQEAALDDDDLRELECLAAAHLRTNDNVVDAAWMHGLLHEPTQDVLTEIHDDALRTTLCTTLGGGTTLPLSSTPDGTVAPSGAEPRLRS